MKIETVTATQLPINNFKVFSTTNRFKNNDTIRIIKLQEQEPKQDCFQKQDKTKIKTNEQKTYIKK